MSNHFIGFISFVFCLSYSESIHAQEEWVDTAAFARIRQAEMSASQVPEIAHYLTDVSGSRLTNSPGFYRAANWAVDQMKKWGLANAGLEPWGEYGRGWDPVYFNISMLKPYPGYILGYPQPWTSNTPGEIRAPVYFVLQNNLRDSAFLQIHRADFKGKIILVGSVLTAQESDFKPFSTRYTDSELVKIPDLYVVKRQTVEMVLTSGKKIGEGFSALKDAGALAIVTSNGTNRDGTVGVQKGSGYKMNSTVYLPQAVISSEDGFKIKRLIASGHPVDISLNIKGEFNSEDTKGYNVVAEIPGTDPVLKDEIVMLGAHLDSWNAATGATDNAAGCVVMMEAVRLLDSLGLKPKRTIRIALWSGEEQGLLGSYNYVRNHFGNGETGILKPEQKKVSAYFNLDNGSGKIRGIFAQGDSAAKPVFEAWLKPFHDLGAQTVPYSNTGSTDHISFEWAGIPGFQFLQDPLDYETKTHHTNMDTYDYLQLDDMKQAAVIVASFVYQASIRPELLPRKKFSPEKFVYDGR